MPSGQTIQTNLWEANRKFINHVQDPVKLSDLHYLINMMWLCALAKMNGVDLQHICLKIPKLLVFLQKSKVICQESSTQFGWQSLEPVGPFDGQPIRERTPGQLFFHTWWGPKVNLSLAFCNYVPWEQTLETSLKMKLEPTSHMIEE